MDNLNLPKWHHKITELTLEEYYKMEHKPLHECYHDINTLIDILESNGYEFTIRLEDTFTWSAYYIIINYPYNDEYNSLSICRNTQNVTNLPVIYLSYLDENDNCLINDTGYNCVDVFYNIDELLDKLEKLGVPKCYNNIKG